MSFIVVDVEADGPIPGDYSMISLGAVVVEPGLNRTFYAEIKPISEKWVPEALAVSGFSREATLAFEDPISVMNRFDKWVLANAGGRAVFVSDNNSFDWMFVCWYFHHFLNRNPFGFSSRRIGDIYSGCVRNMKAGWKHLRPSAHTHNALDDAKGNAGALLKIAQQFGLVL